MTVDHLVDDLQQEINYFDETDDLQSGDMAVFAEPGNYCALYSPTNFEIFYLFEVEKSALTCLDIKLNRVMYI